MHVSPSATPGVISFGRIDLTHATDVGYWCQILQVDHAALRQAVQAVGPQAQAVHDYLHHHGKLPPH